MTQSIYEVLTFADNSTILKRTNEDGTESFIPMDESNADYQAYLNPVKDDKEL